MRKLFFAGIALFASACIAEPGPETTEATTELSSPAPSIEANDNPDLLVVFECSIDAHWYSTRADCVEGCVGGTCFACGRQCQS